MAVFPFHDVEQGAGAAQRVSQGNGAAVEFDVVDGQAGAELTAKEAD